MRLILQLLLILLIVSTISICAIQPDLHKNIIVYDSAYTLVSENEVQTDTKDIPVMEMPAKPVEKTVVSEKKFEPKVITKKTNTVGQALPDKNLNETNKKIQTIPASKQLSTVAKPVTTVQKPVIKEVVKIVPHEVEQKTISTPSPQTSPARSKEVTVVPKILTQQEETIAWNKWRSDLTNRIMQDTHLPNIPNGTVFQFSFNVDRYGKITNVQTGANPANYTPYAIQYIAPVIRSYQGKSILNFPEGTQRTSTQVTGKWRISSSEKYSTPQDYNDVERVMR